MNVVVWAYLKVYGSWWDSYCSCENNIDLLLPVNNGSVFRRTAEEGVSGQSLHIPWEWRYVRLFLGYSPKEEGRELFVWVAKICPWIFESDILIMSIFFQIVLKCFNHYTMALIRQYRQCMRINTAGKWQELWVEGAHYARTIFELITRCQHVSIMYGKWQTKCTSHGNFTKV